MIERTYLKERLDEYIAANNFQLLQMETIYKLIAFKRDAEAQYLNSIDAVRAEAERVAAMPGMFIPELLNDFRNYLAVIYQSQALKVQTYDQEILISLQSAIHKTVDSILANRVVSTEQRIAESLMVVREKKAQLKGIAEEIELLRSEVRFKEKMRSLTAPERTVLAQKFQDLVKLREKDLEVLGQHIRNLVNSSELYSQTYREIEQEERLILEPKASTVYDNVIRAIMVDVTATRNIHYEMDVVFRTFKATNQAFNKERALKAIRSGIIKEKTVAKAGFFEKYRLLASQQPFSLEDRFIPEEIKHDWRQVESNLKGFMIRP